MIKDILNILLGSKSEKEESTENVIYEFKNDYIDNKDFLDLFPPEIRPSIQRTILNIYNESTQGEENLIDPVSHIFSGMQSLYTSLWLLEEGYGEKLIIKMDQLVYTDDYGDICFDEWYRELNRFISSKRFGLDLYLRDNIPDKYQNYAELLGLSYQLNTQHNDIEFSDEEIIEDLAENISLCLDAFHDLPQCNQYHYQFDSINDPNVYELAIADKLTSLGWNCSMTSRTNDQGADVIAEKRGIKLIVQCKLYSSPVGNKAVQEAAAAKGFYHGDLSAVISNADFTKSARQLADSLHVYLLHHSQINSFDEILFKLNIDDNE